jgi:DinB superfamily
MNPYAASLGDRDPVAAMADTPSRIRKVVSALGPAGLSRSYAPGKWTARQLLVHLAQTELAFGVRARMALSTDDYVVQPFDQDRWLAAESSVDADAALAAYEGMRALNLALFRSLSAEDFSRKLHHPERGPQVLRDIAVTLAGHELHHLKHFETIAAAG